MKWVLAECDEAAAAALSRAAGFHWLTARLLVNRGITDPAAARVFLDCGLALLSPPGIFLGMDRAVSRIRQAIKDREKTVVYGDYDVDGVTASSLLYLVLRRLGAPVDCYIPDRMSEGYGLNPAALEKIRASGAGLIITVDCGISALHEADAARSLGLDLIITDHHEFDHLTGINRPDTPRTPVLPAAFAVLHPRLLLPDVSSGIREQIGSLTGVGMAFKLAQALRGIENCDEEMASYLDLVTLGTLADVGTITGENRVLVRHGLERLSRTGGMQRPGIAALKQVTGLNGKISSGTVGFTIAPRINASGRLERADMAFRLLTTDSPEEARRLAEGLDAVNRERQDVEERIREEARGICRREDLARTGAFVLASRDWHPGVIGIVASRIVDEFYRPTALICIKDGIGKGSARSIPGFDLYHGLHQCSELLLGFGGHKYAAGFSIAEDKIEAFRERLSSLVMETLAKDGFVRTLMVDAGVRLEEMTLNAVRELESLSPFGQGNPEPRLGARCLEVVSSRIVGNNHLKLRVRQENGIALDAIAFNRGGLLGKTVHDGARLAAVFTPRINSWNGNAAVELDIKDLRPDTENSKTQTINLK